MFNKANLFVCLTSFQVNASDPQDFSRFSIYQVRKVRNLRPW